MKIIYLDNSIIFSMLEVDRIGLLSNMLNIKTCLGHQKSCYFNMDLSALGYKATNSYAYSSKNYQYISYATLIRQYLISKL